MWAYHKLHRAWLCSSVTYLSMINWSVIFHHFGQWHDPKDRCVVNGGTTSCMKFWSVCHIHQCLLQKIRPIDVPIVISKRWLGSDNDVTTAGGMMHHLHPSTTTGTVFPLEAFISSVIASYIKVVRSLYCLGRADKVPACWMTDSIIQSLSQHRLPQCFN